MTEDTARVTIPREEPTRGPYATLSHCWGKAKRLKLLQSNLAQLRTSITIKDLPTSYLEAIAVCRRFQFRYIWIDSLCIIQDSSEDWQCEAATMKDVYQNSIMNIAAAAAAESSEPSFARRDVSLLQPLKLRAEWDGLAQKDYYLTDGGMYENEVEDSPLRRRAWVIQEVWLTARTLNLTEPQLWWECRQLEACEAYPGGIQRPWLSLARQGAGSGVPPEREELYRRWNKLVETYAACHLTVPSDEMIAFSGIAQHFQE